jgi:hypothetical protein
MSDETENTFLLKRLFPEPLQTLKHKLVTVESVKDESLVVLDANALLLPFRLEQQSYKEIEDVYRKLISEKRLVVPGQALREFISNRGSKLADIHQTLVQRKSDLGNIKALSVLQSPLLDSFNEFKALKKSEAEFSETLRKAKTEHAKKIDSLIKKLESLSTNDPISQSYETLFQDETVFDPELDYDALSSDLAFRNLYKIPPGYKDKSKDSNSEGDFLIWHTILELAKRHKRSTMFVSSEEKSDWFTRSNNKGLFPRFELVEEFRRASKGSHFHIIKLAELLKLNNVTSQVVQEVEKEEGLSRSSIIGLNGDAEAERSQYLKTWNGFVRRCLLQHLQRKHPYHELIENENGFPGLLLQYKQPDGTVHQTAVGYWATPAGAGYDIANLNLWLDAADTFIRDPNFYLNRRAEFYSFHHGGPGTHMGKDYALENYVIPNRRITLIFAVCTEGAPDGSTVRESEKIEGTSMP